MRRTQWTLGPHAQTVTIGADRGTTADLQTLQTRSQDMHTSWSGGAAARVDKTPYPQHRKVLIMTPNSTVSSPPGQRHRNGRCALVIALASTFTGTAAGIATVAAGSDLATAILTGSSIAGATGGQLIALIHLASDR